MIVIILLYLTLCVVICIFHKLMPVLLACGFLASWYSVFFCHQYVPGILLFLVMCLTATLYKVAKGDELKSTSRKKDEDKAQRSSNWIFFLIPIFWPIIIIKLLLSGKTRPTDMTPYDYEQHLKSNAR